jgi:hypothetical protein
MIHFDEKIILTKKVFDEKMFSLSKTPDCLTGNAAVWLIC